MFTKKAKNESLFDWCKTNWKNIALVGLGAIVGAQLLIGLYYGVAFLFFILKGSVGYAAASGVVSHLSTVAMVGLGVVTAGLTAAAVSLFKWFHRPQPPKTSSEIVPKIDEKYEVELVSTHAQVNEHLNSLAHQASHRRKNEIKENPLSNQQTDQSDNNFLDKVKQFFHKLPLLFSKPCVEKPSQTSESLEHSVRFNK